MILNYYLYKYVILIWFKYQKEIIIFNEKWQIVLLLGFRFRTFMHETNKWKNMHYTPYSRSASWWRHRVYLLLVEKFANLISITIYFIFILSYIFYFTHFYLIIIILCTFSSYIFYLLILSSNYLFFIFLIQNIFW